MAAAIPLGMVTLALSGEIFLRGESLISSKCHHYSSRISSTEGPDFGSSSGETCGRIILAVSMLQPWAIARANAHTPIATGRTVVLQCIRPHPESLWFGKYGKPVRGSVRRLLPPHSGASIPSRIPGWWQPTRSCPTDVFPPCISLSSPSPGSARNRTMWRSCAPPFFTSSPLNPCLPNARTLLSPFPRRSPRLYFYK